jgi:predicted Zn finger-like uncharacterized protein
MITTCPHCRKQYRISDSLQNGGTLRAKCQACGQAFTITTELKALVVCPNCSFEQTGENECAKCGVIFSKFVKRTDVIEQPSEADSENPGKPAVSRRRVTKIWALLSVVYLVTIVVDWVMVFDNELERPKRERFAATVDLAERSMFKRDAQRLIDGIEALIDARVSRSEIYDYFEVGCEVLDPEVKLKRTNFMIKATFHDGSILRFIDPLSSVRLDQQKASPSQFFSFFPSIWDLHTKYDNLDYSEAVEQIHDQFWYADFSDIEREYNRSMRWAVGRFVIFGFLVWAVPVLCGYTFCRFLYCRVTDDLNLGWQSVFKQQCD